MLEVEGEVVVDLREVEGSMDLVVEEWVLVVEDSVTFLKAKIHFVF